MNHFIKLLALIFICSSCTENSNDIVFHNIAQNELDNALKISQERGREFFNTVQTEFFTSPNNLENKEKRAKIEFELEKMHKIDSVIYSLNKLIYSIKFELLSSNEINHEAINSQKKEYPKHIMENQDINTYFPIKISGLSLKNSSKSIFFDKNKPSKLYFNLMDQWNSTLQGIIKQVSYHHDNEEIVQSSINLSKIPSEFTIDSFKKSLTSKINEKEDLYVLFDIFSSLYKDEFNRKSDKKQGLDELFLNSDIRQTFYILTTLQNDLLKARTVAFAHISSKIGACNYVFDQISVIVNGPNAATKGDSVEFSVQVVAIDTYNNPYLKVDQTVSPIKIKDGKATFKAKIPSNKDKTKFTGNISIVSKSGLAKKYFWEQEVKIVE